MIDQIGQSIYEFVNPVFIVVFMLTAFLVNKSVKSKTVFKWIKPKIRTFWRTLVVGILVGVLFFVLNEEYTKKEVLSYVISIFLSMAFLWGGLKEWVTDLKGKVKDIKESVNPANKEEAS